MTIRISEKLETDGNSGNSFAIIRNYWELPGHLVERAGGLTSLALQAGELASWLAGWLAGYARYLKFPEFMEC